MLKITNNVLAYIHGGSQAEAEDGNVTINCFLKEAIMPVDEGKLYPYHAIDALKVDMEDSEVDPPEDITCPSGEPEPKPEPTDPPSFRGVDDVTIAFGMPFDPRHGVVAIDGNGDDVNFTEEGSVDSQTPGEYTLTYTATDAWGKTTTVTRKITVANPTTVPVFHGLTHASVRQGIGFDLANGVTAVDAKGRNITFTYSPTSIEECEVGDQTITYTATDEWGNTGIGTRIITVTQIANPGITGLTTLNVKVDQEFDPLSGVTGTDANGNPVEVTVSEGQQ